MTIVAPYDDAANWLNKNGVDWSEMYHENNNGDLRVNNKSVVTESLRQISNAAKVLPFNSANGVSVATVAYNAVQQTTTTQAAKERTTQENKAMVENVAEQRVAGALANATMESLNDQLDPETPIKWRPSTADEQDINHAKQYGRTMTFERAYELGLGRQYGCKCSMDILDPPDDLTTLVE